MPGGEPTEIAPTPGSQGPTRWTTKARVPFAVSISTRSPTPPPRSAPPMAEAHWMPGGEPTEIAPTPGS
jgi:hypothetical protein